MTTKTETSVPGRHCGTEHCEHLTTRYHVYATAFRKPPHLATLSTTAPHPFPPLVPPIYLFIYYVSYKLMRTISHRLHVYSHINQL